MVVSRYEDDVYALLREQRPHGCARIMKHIDRVQYAHSCTLDDTLVTIVLSERVYTIPALKSKSTHWPALRKAEGPSRLSSDVSQLDTQLDSSASQTL